MIIFSYKCIYYHDISLTPSIFRENVVFVLTLQSPQAGLDLRYGDNNLRCECSLRPVINWLRAGGGLCRLYSIDCIDCMTRAAAVICF